MPAPQYPKPLVAITLGDVAGVGPEIAVRVWSNPSLHDTCRPFVVGDVGVLSKALDSMPVGGPEIVPIDSPEAARPSPQVLPCLQGTTVSLEEIPPGQVDARAGRAAYDFLNLAIDQALAHRVDALVTLPLHKEALHAAGIAHPGHTEILAERCGVADFAMMLYLPHPYAQGPAGLGVLHATLHVSLREVFNLLTVDRVLATIRLADETLRPLLPPESHARPRIAVAGLNPHAGESGLFGDEEKTIIAPAIARALSQGIDVQGPIAADTLFARALGGEFDAVVAMYHDQGHVALKTLGFHHAVNVTLGLPIVRTSVAHGTAFDIVGRNQADTTSLLEAARVAAQLVEGRRRLATLAPW